MAPASKGPAPSRLLAALLWAGLGLSGLLLVIAGWNLRHPALHGWRPFVFPVLSALCLLHPAVAWRFARRRRARLVLLLLAPLALGAGSWAELRLMMLRASVMAMPDDALRAVGRHIIVGYSDDEAILPLVTRAEIAGIYVSRRNAAGRSTAQLAAEIAALQAARRRHNLPPLWIAADQEGGAVASLSPPLPRPPALADLVGRPGRDDALRRAAEDIGCLGVTLNFAPVVDRLTDASASDGTTRIAARAIGQDEGVIAGMAAQACRVMAGAGVQCTLKHFPGIGGAGGDTHLGRVRIPGLDARDLLPFREVIRTASPWIMVSHVTVDAIDPHRPASASAPVLAVLRDQWGFDGLVITDDVSMRSFAPDLRNHAVAAIRAGVDVLLVSYDTDLVYDVMEALLEARRRDPAFAAALSASAARLARAPAPTARCRSRT